MTRTMAVITATACVAAVGIWLALLLLHTTSGICPTPAPQIHPSQPGAPAANWQPPQHRWETTPR